MLNTTLIRQVFIPALRSGEFKQTDGRLRSRGIEDDVFHCCLGVACEIARRKEMVTAVWTEYNSFVVQGWAEERYELPDPIQNIYGFTMGEGVMVSINGQSRSLAGHNDHGRTFLEIADALETYCNGYDEARSQVTLSINSFLTNDME